MKKEECEDDANIKLIMSQTSEKDVEFRFDSEIVFETIDGTLIMTVTVYTDEGPVSGTRHFVQYNLDNLGSISPNNSRRGSYSVSPSRRSSMSLAPQPFLRKLSTEIHDSGLHMGKSGNNLLSPEKTNHVNHRRPSIEISHFN